jgi:hypothetical protein
MKRVVPAAVAAIVAMALSAAAPASAATFDGVCQVRATAFFELPLTPFPTDQKWRLESNSGTCTGVYNGGPVVEVPISVKAQGRILGSCGILTAGFGLNGTATFPASTPSPSGEDNTLDFRLDVVSAGFQNTVHLSGKDGGEAAGRASIVGVEDPAAELQKCVAGNGSRVFGLQAQIAAVRIRG